MSHGTDYPRVLVAKAVVTFSVESIYNSQNGPPNIGVGFYEWFMEKKAELEKMYPNAAVNLTANLESGEA